ncbi:Protein of unknown function DUF2358 [Dillenia turbinata]|uniref:Uncharacterized protein n=1 Tax=Dillenia turbinata TaxID=194707 RepID=A0AAN8Z0Q0_9MAGN
MAFIIPSPTNILSNPNPKDLTTKFRVLKRNAKIENLIRVCARIKDCEVRVSDCSQNLRLSTQSWVPIKESSPPPSSSKQSKEDEEKQNYYLNTGYAIRTLREEFPELFYRELTFDIYRDDIVFKDPLNSFIGIENYKSIFWALRFHGQMFFKALWVDIVSVWQPVENVIMVRWTVHGISRIPWESRGRFDGTSEYKLDKNGKIYEHRVHNIALNSPPKFRVLAVEELIQSAVCPSTPKPTYFEISPFSAQKFTPLLVKFTSVKNHIASVLHLVPKSRHETSQRT